MKKEYKRTLEDIVAVSILHSRLFGVGQEMCFVLLFSLAVCDLIRAECNECSMKDFFLNFFNHPSAASAVLA
jgi:hypothetical protein